MNTFCNYVAGIIDTGITVHACNIVSHKDMRKEICRYDISFMHLYFQIELQTVNFSFKHCDILRAYLKQL